MSTIYNYQIEAPFSITFQTRGDVTREAVAEDVKQGMTKAAAQQFAEEMLKHPNVWWKIDSTETTITELKIIPQAFTPFISWQAKGKTNMTFESDKSIKDELSPQGWEELLYGIWLVFGAFVLGHGTLFGLIILIVAIVVGAVVLTHSGGVKAIIFGQGSGVLGDIGTILIIIVILLFLFGALPTIQIWLKGKKKAKGKKAKE